MALTQIKGFIIPAQVGQYPAISLLKAAERDSKNRTDDEILILAGHAVKTVRASGCVSRGMEENSMGGMIPLSDASRRPSSFPIITTAIIVANAVVFVMELAGGDAFVMKWSEIPAHIVAGHDWITILTAMFMHAGWMHIIGNMVFLWAFGPEIEDSMGPLKYLVFYLLSGLAASLAQLALMPHSTVPNLGASGAIAGVMGAFIVTYPQDKIRTVLLLGWFVDITAIPALLLIGFWFVIQLFSQVGAVASAQGGGGVAYAAHVGGFIFGAVTARLFEGSGGASE
jgi:membrane associated rhomboid family serine protease